MIYSYSNINRFRPRLHSGPKEINQTEVKCDNRPISSSLAAHVLSNCIQVMRPSEVLEECHPKLSVEQNVAVCSAWPHSLPLQRYKAAFFRITTIDFF